LTDTVLSAHNRHSIEWRYGLPENAEETTIQIPTVQHNSSTHEDRSTGILPT